jgi:uncharacterized protein (TIGR02453 family)
MGAFRGFSERTIQFLRDVREHNAKEWFERNRPVYERELLEPMRDLVADLSGTMLSIDPELETRPAVGKTISRIHRDTRFSRDKSLYRDAMWITFKRRSENWTDGPAFFFELRTDGYRYGMGFYAASKATMDKLREWIDEEPDDFRRTTAFYGRQKTFVLEGELYKRVLDPDKPESVLEWYQRKNIYLACNRAIDGLLFSPKLVDEIAAGFGMLGGLYHTFRKLRMRAAAGA